MLVVGVIFAGGCATAKQEKSITRTQLFTPYENTGHIIQDLDRWVVENLW
jgi:hypothetical protein